MMMAKIFIDLFSHMWRYVKEAHKETLNVVHQCQYVYLKTIFNKEQFVIARHFWAFSIHICPQYVSKPSP